MGAAQDFVSNDSHDRKSGISTLLYGLLFLVILLASFFALGRIGLPAFTLFLGLSLLGMFYFYVSLRYLRVPFYITILSVGGFRFLWSVSMPGLPDLYVDRMAMIWLTVIFGVKAIAERRPLRGPYLLDALLVVNALYLFLSIYFHDMMHFNLWTKSYLFAYSAYFMAKNIVTNQKSIRILLAVFAILNLYYAVTSIAEKFNITYLIWPHSILYQENMWWGRSNGPFNHAPLFGTVQGMILPVYLYFIATAKSRLVKILNYLALALGLGGLYFTYTRGSWLVGLVALFVTIVMNRRDYLRISLPAIALLPLIAIFVLGAGNDAMMKDRVDDDQTITARLGVAVTAMRMFRDNPVIGVGFFQYRHVRQFYIDPVEVPVFGVIRFANFRHTSLHDIYWGPLAETGLLGAFLQFSIYLIIFKTFLRCYRNRAGPDHFRLFILPVFVGMSFGYLVGGISIDYRFFSIVATMFYSIAGISYGFTGDEDEEFRDLEA